MMIGQSKQREICHVSRRMKMFEGERVLWMINNE